MKKERIEQLDSLRGLAALIVLFHHYFYIIPTLYQKSPALTPSEYLIKFTPLHIFWAGSEAVMFFFVLSGFVLALPFLSGKSIAYIGYMIKRILRIYLPYAVAVAISIFAAMLFYRGGDIPELSEWFNSKWDDRFSIEYLLGFATMIFSYNNGEFNPVLWSLVQEMRVSLIFPLLMYFVIRFNWKYVMAIAVTLSVLGYGLHYVTYHVNYKNDYFITFHYLLMFTVGAIVAKHRVPIVNYAKQLSSLKITVLVFIALLCCTYSWWFFPQSSLLHMQMFDEWMSTIGVCVLLICSIAFDRFKNVLLIAPIHYLGKISYSLYLYHAIALLIFVNVFYYQLPVPMIWLLALVTSLLVSSLSYHFIEIPSIKLGQYYSTKISKPKNQNKDFVQPA
ncbi:acyltransferase family protein [Paenibacillus chartarius]|uniref:Acyltransferase family protein n=1 Tax=Paenibacillus chartarius TaxID=747481 RepID=A0ABV6DUG4_9BACL